MKPPLYFETKERLVFPNVCLRCARDTRHNLVIHARSCAKEEEMAILGRVGGAVPGAHFALLFVGMGYEKVKIPFCWHCHVNQNIPPPEICLHVIGMLALLGAGFYFLAHDLLGYGLGCLLLGLVVTIVIARHENTHQRKVSLPIKVYYEKGVFQYHIWDGPLYDFVKLVRSTPPPAPVSPQPGD